MTSSTVRRAIAVVVGVTLVLGACTSTDPKGAAKPLGAAEPAVSPQPTRRPTGIVAPIGTDPEGLAYDSVTDILAIAVRDPTQLVLVQGATGEEVRRVALPGHARHLSIAQPGGPVLVADEDSHALVSVSIPGGETSSIRIGRYPHAAVRSSSGRVVVADELGGRVVVLDGGAVVHEFADAKQPGGLAAVGDDVAVVDVGRFTLSLYDVDDPNRLDRVDAGSGPTHLVAVSGNRLVVTDTRGDTVLMFGTVPLRQISALKLPGVPYGIAYDEQREIVWVTLTERNEVVALDVSGATPRVVDRLPTIRQPNTIAVDPGSGRLWIAGRRTGELETIDP